MTVGLQQKLFGGSIGDWLPLAALGVSFIGASLGSCICGHIAQWALPFTVSASAVGWWAFLKRSSANFVWKLLRMAVVIALSMLLAKNLADALWFGHGAWLR